MAVELARKRGLTLRDTALILELSHQRVAQLLDEHDRDVERFGDRLTLALYLDMAAKFTRYKDAISFRAGDPPERAAEAKRRLEARLAKD